METTQKNEKTARISAILYAFNVLRLKNEVKSQKDFAKKLGINEQTMSAALRGREGYLTESLLRKVADYMSENHGINIYDQQGMLNVAASPMVIEGDQKILGSSEKEVQMLIAEMSAQRMTYSAHIDRLLGIIENMQK